MEVEYEITVDDVVAFNIYHSRSSRSLARMRRWTWVFALVALGVILVSLVGSDDPRLDLTAFLPSIAGIVLVMLYLALGLRGTAERSVRRLLGDGPNLGMLGPRGLTMNEEGFRVVSDFIETSVRWPAVERVAATDEHAFLFTSAMSADIIPARAFADEAAFLAFVETASRFQQRNEAGSPDVAGPG